jgi:signal transduction histidine kinase/ligand-binding sensor domain-containing protein
MKKETIPGCKKVIPLLVTLFFISCNITSDVPFPGDETEFEQPATRNLRLSAPVKINWISSKQDSIVPPINKPLDFSQIPTKPFYFDGFKPVAPPAEEKISWDNMPGVPFDIDTIAAKPLEHKTIKIDFPVRIKAGIAKAKIPVSKNIVQLSQDEGLPGGTVSQIYQDKKGIFWIATGKGLCRYDGEYFELFTFISKEAQGNVQVLQITEDRLGKLWIRTQTRVYVFDYSGGLVQSITNNTYDITADNKGDVWMVSYPEKISVVNPETMMAQKIDARVLSDSGIVVRLIKGDNDQLLFRTGEGVSVLDLQKKSIYQWHGKHTNNYDNVSFFFKTHAGNILIGNYEGMLQIKPAISVLQHLKLNKEFETALEPYSATEDKQGRIWHYNQNIGVEVLDLENKTILKMNHQDGLSENNITCLFNDSDGRIWIGTNSGGINIIDNNSSINHLSVNQGLNDNEVWSLVEDDNGNVWAGNATGIDVINLRQQSIRQLGDKIQMGKGYDAIPKLMKDKDGLIWAYSATTALSVIDIQKKIVKIYDEKKLPFRRGLKLLGDQRGRVWISAFGQGVFLLNPETNVFRHINSSNGLAGNIAWRLLEDKDGRIWIATNKGLSIVEADASGITNITKTDGLSDNVTQSLAQDEQGRMWVATNEGIDMINMTNKTVTAFTKRQGMTENEAYALEISGKKIFAGTSSGINIIEDIGKENMVNWKVKTFARPQGFYFVDVNSNTSLISKDKQVFWGIQHALTIMNDPGDDSIIKPAYISGLSVNGKQQYFHGEAKVLQELADTIWSERSDTFYTKANVNNNVNKKDQIHWDSTNGMFKLAHDQNQVSFQFTGMHTDNEEKARYRYILQGLDDHWSAITQKAQSPDYNNLSPGSYTFKVSTRGANGLWSKPATLSFSILPPWWKTWWAYLLYSVVAISIIRSYVLYRSRRLQKENLMLEEKIDQRTRELKQSLNNLKSTQAQLIQSEKMASLGELTAGIAHEIQNPLNFVNNFSDINKELVDELQQELKAGKIDDAIEISNDIKANEEKINHHGKRADAIVKGMLQHSRSSSGQKEPTDINALCDEYLRLSYHGLRAKDKSFNADFKTDFDESIGKINIIPQDIGRVLLNIVNNAFYAVNEKQKAADKNYKPLVSIKTKRISDTIEINVEDNGNGISQNIVNKIFQPFFTTKPTGQGTGLGLSLSYDIVKANGGEIKMESKENDGTIFTILLPA